MTAKQLLEHSLKCELLNNRISRIIVYDNLGMSILTKDSFTWILMEKLKSWLSGNVVQYVSEGFVGFKCNYPGLCSKSRIESVDPVMGERGKVTSTLFKGDNDGDTKRRGGEDEDDGPSLILPFLYLGSMKDAQDQQVLRVS